MRYYSSVAVETTLSAGCSAPAVMIVVASTSGFPILTPYTLCIDAETANKELVEVTSVAGTTLTVTRGIDGTSAVAHSLGATVSHDHSARDFRESREHEDATVAHGATGAVVGTTNTQTLTNKDLSSGTNSFPSSLATDAEVATALSGKADLVHTHAESDVTGLVAALAAKASLTGAETLTNKNLTSGTNTFPTSLVTLTGVQTLTNKLLGGPTVTDPTILKNSNTATTTPYFVANLAALPSASVAAGDIGVTADGKLYQRRSGVWTRTDTVAHTRYALTANITCTSGVDTILTGWTVEDAAVGITVNSGAGTFSPTEAGVYTIAGTIAYVANATGRRCAIVYVNGAERVRSAIATSSTGGTFVNVVTTLRLAASDTVSLVVNQTAGVPLDAALAETHLSLVRNGS